MRLDHYEHIAINLSPDETLAFLDNAINRPSDGMVITTPFFAPRTYRFSVTDKKHRNFRITSKLLGHKTMLVGYVRSEHGHSIIAIRRFEDSALTTIPIVLTPVVFVMWLILSTVTEGQTPCIASICFALIALSLFCLAGYVHIKRAVMLAEQLRRSVLTNHPFPPVNQE